MEGVFYVKVELYGNYPYNFIVLPVASIRIDNGALILLDKKEGLVKAIAPGYWISVDVCDPNEVEE